MTSSLRENMPESTSPMKNLSPLLNLARAATKLRSKTPESSAACADESCDSCGCVERVFRCSGNSCLSTLCHSCAEKAKWHGLDELACKCTECFEREEEVMDDSCSDDENEKNNVLQFKRARSVSPTCTNKVLKLALPRTAVDEPFKRTLLSSTTSSSDATSPQEGASASRLLVGARRRDSSVELGWQEMPYELPQHLSGGGVVFTCTRSSFPHIQHNRHLLTFGESMSKMLDSVIPQSTPIFLLNQTSKEIMGMFYAMEKPTKCSKRHSSIPCFEDATVQLHIERVRGMPVLSKADGDLPDFFHTFGSLKDMMGAWLEEDEVLVLLHSIAKKHKSVIARTNFHQRGGGCGRTVHGQAPADVRQMLQGAAVFFIGNSFARATYLDMVRLLAELSSEAKAPIDTQLSQKPEVREAMLPHDTLLKYFHSRECYSAAFRDHIAPQLEEAMRKGDRPGFVVMCPGPTDLALPRADFESKHRRLLARLGPCSRHPNFSVIWLTCPPQTGAAAIASPPQRMRIEQAICAGNVHTIKMAESALRSDGSNFVQVVDAWAECSRNRHLADVVLGSWHQSLHRQITRMVLTKIRQGLSFAKLRKVSRIMTFLS